MRFSLFTAAQFRLGLIWRIERNLEVLKERAWEDELPDERIVTAIGDLTRWLQAVQCWDENAAAHAMRRLNRRSPHLVRRCVKEAAEFERELFAAIVGDTNPREVAA